MKPYLIYTALIALLYTATAKAQPHTLNAPKLVVGIVIDQMRWDNLYRYNAKYGSTGFNKLLKQGYSCNNTFIPYTPTVTAAGHTCIYTGSVPAYHGMVGNAWYSKQLKRNIYCTEDSTVTSVGSTTKNGAMSPANMLTTTITDQLKLATNQVSKTVGIAIKDRGAILPAGHTADAAYWYDSKTGNWITSSHYTQALPAWVTTFNNRKMVDSLYALNWNTINPILTYTNSNGDEHAYEGKLLGEKTSSFPHNLQQYIGKNYDQLPNTPQGNTFTLAMAMAAIDNMQLGRNSVTDFLAISLSSPDYVGHKYGPNSIEIEDTYIRLDKELGNLLVYLDQTIGMGKYTVFLTADHGVAHIPGYLQELKIPAGSWDNDAMVKDINTMLKARYGVANIVLGETNYQLYLNDSAIQANTLDRVQLVRIIVQYCEQQKGIAQAFDLHQLTTTTLAEPLRTMLINGYHKKRSGDVQIILEPAYIDGGKVGTTHGLWNPYDSHIPMLWYGAGIATGYTNATMYMTDIAPTLAALLHIEIPNACVGKVMDGVLLYTMQAPLPSTTIKNQKSIKK